jgi:hypothetical protein
VNVLGIKEADAVVPHTVPTARGTHVCQVHYSVIPDPAREFKSKD